MAYAFILVFSMLNYAFWRGRLPPVQTVEEREAMGSVTSFLALFRKAELANAAALTVIPMVVCFGVLRLLGWDVDPHAGVAIMVAVGAHRYVFDAQGSVA